MIPRPAQARSERKQNKKDACPASFFYASFALISPSISRPTTSANHPIAGSFSTALP
jgi:hypothetical protein